MENWKEYQKGLIPNDEYLGRVVYQEGMKPVIELDPLSIKDITSISIEFNQVYSIRVFEEHSAVWKIFEESLKFDEDNYANIIYEVENGDYTSDIRKFAGEKLCGITVKQYVVFTLNYYFEIVTDSEPLITINKLKEERGYQLKYCGNYVQKKVKVIFNHLEYPILMSKSDSYYECYVDFPEGEYKYKFLLDDGLELIDNSNKHICEDDNNFWSVLTIDKDKVVYKEIERNAKLYEYGIFHRMLEIVPNKIESKVFNPVKDKIAVCMISFIEIQGFHITTVAWYKPNGELYRFAENDFGSYDKMVDDNIILRFWINLSEIDRRDYGSWTVRTFLDGQIIKEDNIVISDNINRTVDTTC